LNVGLFLYANGTINFFKRDYVKFQKLEGLAYSLKNLRNKDYTNLLFSQLGSYKIEDLILETGVLMTIGKKLENLHGSPFIFKMFVFSYYIGILSSIFWVKSNYAKRNRYYLEEPVGRDLGNPQTVGYKFMSQHTICMSFVYFYLLKTVKLRMFTPLVLAGDMIIWGPYYGSGALTGLAAGMIL
jgi:hypothetical protein